MCSDEGITDDIIESLIIHMDTDNDGANMRAEPYLKEHNINNALMQVWWVKQNSLMATNIGVKW